MKRFEIEITRHDSKSDTYVARYASPLLGAVYTVEFPDSVTGAVALHYFAEMLKSRYPLAGATHFVFPLDGTLTPIVRDAIELEHAPL